MKQLIHSIGPHVIAALNESAYVVVSSTSNNNTAVVVELSPTKESGGGDVSNGNPIHGVASTLSLDGKTLLCAVSRQDKTLALHSIPLVGEGEESSKVVVESGKKVEPIAFYKTQKRAGSLIFARVPSGADKDPLDILIAGDFEGNVTAYPVPDTSGSEAPTAANSNRSRLLLGHTASMLTGVKIAESSIDNKTRILTSDRDEKIRVGSFPNTFIVEGYLLGHTAFVSSLDVSLDKDCPYCVTCGGDKTIRLWDYKICQELDVVEATNSEEEEGKQDEKEKEKDIDIPISVAMSPDGKIVAAIWNESTRVDIFKVVDGSLDKIQTFECPKQPMVAIFLADGTLCLLAKDPAYLLQYEAVCSNGEKGGEVTSFTSTTEKSSLCTALRDVGRQQKIAMTLSTLEVDELKKVEVKNVQDTRDKEWNNAERKERAKARTARRKKRKREAKRAGLVED